MTGRTLLAFIAVCLMLPAALAGRTRADRLPATSHIEPGYDRTVAERRMTESGMHRIEGIWQLTENGATVAIERSSDGLAGEREEGLVLYRMILLQSPDRQLRAGTVMGYIAPSGQADSYDARIYTAHLGESKLGRAKEFTFTLCDNGNRLTFHPRRSRYTIELWRMLPYMFRSVIRRGHVTETARSGCIRLFPEPMPPHEPRWL